MSVLQPCVTNDCIICYLYFKCSKHICHLANNKKNVIFVLVMKISKQIDMSKHKLYTIESLCFHDEFLTNTNQNMSFPLNNIYSIYVA